MLLARPVYSERGELLLNADVELTDRYVDMLERRGFKAVYVRDAMTGEVSLPDVVPESIRRTLASSLWSAFEMLERDVGNMAAYFGQFAPELKFTRYAKEMWALYQEGKLTPQTELTGEFAEPEDAADLDAVLREIKATLADQARKEALRNATDEPRDEPPTPPWMRN